MFNNGEFSKGYQGNFQKDAKKIFKGQHVACSLFDSPGLKYIFFSFKNKKKLFKIDIKYADMKICLSTNINK